MALSIAGPSRCAGAVRGNIGALLGKPSTPIQEQYRLVMESGHLYSPRDSSDLRSELRIKPVSCDL